MNMLYVWSKRTQTHRMHRWIVSRIIAIYIHIHMDRMWTLLLHRLVANFNALYVCFVRRATTPSISLFLSMRMALLFPGQWKLHVFYCKWTKYSMKNKLAEKFVLLSNAYLAIQQRFRWHQRTPFMDILCVVMWKSALKKLDCPYWAHFFLSRESKKKKTSPTERAIINWRECIIFHVE